MLALILRQLGLWLFNTAQAAWAAQVQARRSVGMGITGTLTPEGDAAIFVVRLNQSPVESITITDSLDLPRDGLVHFDNQVVGTVDECSSPRYCPLAGPEVIRITGDFAPGAQPFIRLHVILRT